jgi:predicted nucleotidyltransferase component of viral defense system
LIDQKINALLNRTKARDLYDVNFLVNNHLSSFSEEALAKLKETFNDLESLENEYKLLFRDDYLFSEELLYEIVLNLESKRELL